MKPQTVSCAPTWRGIMPVMLRILEDPKTKETAKTPIRDELMSLASRLDAQNGAEPQIDDAPKPVRKYRKRKKASGE